MNINNPKHAPVHPAAIEFRLYGGKRARPASHDTGARYNQAPPDYAMTGGVTPKKGACNKRIKSFERHGQRRYYRLGVVPTAQPCATIRGQRSHGARRRERRRLAIARAGRAVFYLAC